MSLSHSSFCYFQLFPVRLRQGLISHPHVATPSLQPGRFKPQSESALKEPLPAVCRPMAGQGGVL